MTAMYSHTWVTESLQASLYKIVQVFIDNSVSISVYQYVDL